MIEFGEYTFIPRPRTILMSMGLRRTVFYLFASLLVMSAASPANAINRQIGTLNIPKSTHQPLTTKGLYRVDIKCTLIPIRNQSNDLEGLLQNIIVDPLVTSAGVLTFSTKRIGLNGTPSADSIFALIPFDDRIQSSKKVKSFDNHTCSQSFLINGKNDIFMTAVYSKSITQQPSRLLAVVGAVSGVAQPLLNVIPGGSGAAAIIQQIQGASNPYSNLLSAFNQEDAHVDSDKIGVGNYSVRTSNATVQVSVTSIQSVLQSGTPSILRAFERRIATIPENIAAHPDTCVREGMKLENDENFGRSDVVYALSEAVTQSGLPLQKIEQCLTRRYGPAVAKTPNWINNIDQQVSDYDCPLQYDNGVAFDRSHIDDLLFELRSSTDAGIDRFFETTVRVKDYSGSFSTKPDMSGRDLLEVIKAKGYTQFGCPYNPKDESYYDSERRLASFFILAAKRAPNPSSDSQSNASKPFRAADATVVIFWWRGSAIAPRIFEAYLSQPTDFISKILKKWNNACSPTMKFEDKEVTGQMPIAGTRSTTT